VSIVEWWRRLFQPDQAPDYGRDSDIPEFSDKPTETVVAAGVDPPAGFRLLFRTVRVAGISYRARDAARFVNGTERKLELQKEPGNPKDRNAIMVFGIWHERGVPRRAHLGYVPHDKAEEIASRYALNAIAAVPGVFFKPLKFGSTPGVRFAVWTDAPRPPRKKPTVRIKTIGR
jgi:hypothetical protein